MLELRREILVRDRSRARTRTLLPALPQQHDRQAERRVVLGVQPQLEHESPSGRALVEVQADLPRAPP